METTSKLNSISNDNNNIDTQTKSKSTSYNKVASRDIIDSLKNKKLDDDVKVFLKIKKVEVSDEKLFYKIYENKKKFSLFDPIRRVDSDKSTIIEVDKIFTDEEHSYVYEEVCRDVVKESLTGKSFCFIAYGLTHTGKKSILFGGKDCVTNINSRGIFLRLLENIINTVKSNKMDLSLNLSYFAVNKNRYIDLSNLSGKQILDMSETQIDSDFKKINKTIEFSNLLKKLPVDGNLNEIIHFYTNLLGLFYKLEASKGRLYSRTHFVFAIRLSDNQGKPISNLVFCLLAGSEGLSLDINTNSKSYNKNSPYSNTNSSYNINKPEEAIYIQSSFLNLITCITASKTRDQIDQSSALRPKEIPFDEFTLTYCLKYFISDPSVKYRIIGCTQPNTGYYDSVKDTLLFLLKCKKTSLRLDENNKITKTESKPPEQARDEILYELENKIRTQEKTISKLNETISNLNKKIEQNEANYKKNLEIIKNAFGFEGDINKLTLNDEYLKESKYARNIKESFERVKYLNNRITDYEKKFEELQEENKKLMLEKRIVENDKVMVTLFSKLKEDNLHEENKLKILLTNSKEFEELKKENEMLKKQIEGYKKDSEEKNKFIQNLPTLLNAKIENNRNFAIQKDELKNELEKKFKNSLHLSNSNFREELKITTRNYEGTIKQKNEEILSYKNELKEIQMSHENEVKEYKEELVQIFEKFNTVMDAYRKNFDFMKKVGSSGFNSQNQIPTNFLIHLQSARENFDKICESVTSNILKGNFPLMLKEWDKYSFDNKNPKTVNFKEIQKSCENLKRISGASASGTSKKSYQEEEKFINESKEILFLKNNKTDLKQSKNFSHHPLRNKKNLEVSLSASDVSDEVDKIKIHKDYKPEELEKMEKANLNNIIYDLQKSIKDFKILFEKVKKYKRGYSSCNLKHGNIENNSNLQQENEKLKSEIQQLVKIKNCNKITIESQERLIEKLSIGNFLNNNYNNNHYHKNIHVNNMKTEIHNKVTAVNTANNFFTNVRATSPKLNRSSPIRNIISAKNHSVSNLKVRPHTGKSIK